MPRFVQGDLFEDSDPKPISNSSQNPIPASNAVPNPTHSSSSPSTKRTFLGWDRPVLDSASDLLLAGFINDRLIDLSHRLVIVPTQHAGRRLRETLASKANGVVVPPMIVPPEFLISPTHNRPNSALPVAGNAQVLLTWADLLRQIDLDHFRHIFPIDPVERSFAWAIQTAGDILTMRKTLGEAGLNINDAANTLAEEGMEPGRWRQLADLEQRALIKLKSAGLDEFESARRAAAQSVSLPPGISSVLILATPDPTPLVIDALQTIATHTEIEVAIHAPSSRSNHFDIWGRPITQMWVAEQIAIPDPTNTIHLCANPSAQAELASQLIQIHQNPAGFVAIGVPDEELIPALERELAIREIDTFNPGGQPLPRHELYNLLRLLSDLIASRPYSAFAQLIRCPDFTQAVATSYQNDNSSEFDTLTLIKNFDDLYNAHLPDNLEHTANSLTKHLKNKTTPEQSYTLTYVNRWLTRFDQEPLTKSLPDFLSQIYGHRDLQSDHLFGDISVTILEYLEELESNLTKKLKHSPTTAELLSLLLQLLAKQSIYPDRFSSQRVNIDLQGWLELLWEDSPHLIVTGFNEGKVPDAILGDAYLPNRARHVLKIRDNEHRLARDAYYLTALIESRRTTGRVDLIVGKTANNGSPLNPSRLLFHCPDSELPTRTHQLFRRISDSAKAQATAWTRSWQLTPPPLPEDAKIRRQLSVTQFSDYLQCPFRFFLKHGLGMQEFENEKLEMDSRDFGNLCHDALEAFGKDSSIKNSTDPREISHYLTQRLDRQVTQIYGHSLPVPILIQLESAKQRLDWAAKIQAKEREAGWIITDVEWLIPKNPETNLPTWTIDNMPVSFKIDRIERNEHTGNLRVLDYKTSDTATPPQALHLKKTPLGKHTTDFPNWALTTDADGKLATWTNLQLPLYILALRDKYPGADDVDITTGLFKLPKAASETKIDLWEELSENDLDSAMVCATGVINAIRSEIFWPPTPDKQLPAWDPFKKLFFDNAEDAISRPI